MSEDSTRPFRFGFWTAVSGVLVAALGIIAYFRFTRGIGAVTNLSDGFPWGLWIGFDVLCGVGLAAGGFAITATVHILHLKDFKPIVRPAVLTAYLGYMLVIVGLIFDLGKPWNIWHPIIMWNPHSVMFEVGWCVMLYTTVLSFEFLPVVLERFRFSKLLGVVRSVTPVAVVVGVILSTLHQSSLGSLFLILPHKVHPLWYSPMLPVLFFVSALAAGIGMTVVESFFSRRVFGRALETELLGRLSRASVVVLGVYLVLRLRDLWVREALETLWPLTREGLMFGAEVGLGAILPMVLLASASFRRSPRRLAWAQGLVVLGFIFQRLNVSVTAVEAATGQRYVPSVSEFTVSVSLVALGMWAFVLACRFLPIFPQEAEAEPATAPAGVREPVPVPVADVETVG
ncbi:MAG: Ni/Fe-hydrogenase cytochrome b subunit [Thermoanaerobaculaceae bacterium]|jgi:Ni/Fe-hydrogenase subunit HybB-like protein|nr:Ni/Fe-hydrogenase cytochrome b subunit [Thermoanaerobaculaceae bacterium]